MENQPRFDLNAALENWRVELAAQPGLSPDDRRELETHLRDTFAELKSRGLSEEESFWLARRRVGQPKKLAEEFIKADPFQIWRERVFWMWLAIFSLGVWQGLINAATVSLMPVRGGSFSDIIMMPQLLNFLSLTMPVVATLLLAKGKMSWLFSKLKSIFKSRLRLTVALFGVLAFIAAANTLAATAYNGRLNHLHDRQFFMPTGLGLWPQPNMIYALVLILLLPPQKCPAAKSI
jgi:hypothetical protein